MEKISNIEKSNKVEEFLNSLNKLGKTAILASGLFLTAYSAEAQKYTREISPTLKTEIENKSLMVDSLTDVMTKDAMKKNLCKMETTLIGPQKDIEEITYVYHPVALSSKFEFAVYGNNDKHVGSQGNFSERKEIYIDGKRFVVSTFNKEGSKKLYLSAMQYCDEIPTDKCSSGTKQTSFMKSPDEKVGITFSESGEDEYTAEGFLVELNELTKRIEQEIKSLEK